MNQPVSANHIVRDAVSSADHQRRSQDAARVVARTAPIGAGVVLLAAVVGRVAGWPAGVTAAVWVALAVCLVAVMVISRRPRRTTDVTAARADADAHLAGELRSAHWFATTESNDPWTVFHVERAAERLRAVTWPDVYPAVPLRRAWMIAGLVSVLAFTLPLALSALHRTSPWPAGVVADGAPMSAELRDEVLAVAAAMQSSHTPLDDVLAAASQILVSSGADPKLRQQVNDLLTQGRFSNPGAEPDAAPPATELVDANPKAPRSTMPDELRRALDQLAAGVAKESKLSEKARQDDTADATGQAGPSKAPPQGVQSVVSSEKGDEAQGQVGTEASQSTQGGGTSGEMMMDDSGAAMASPGLGLGGKGTANPVGTGDVTQIAAALKLELIEAHANIDGSEIQTEDARRKTEQGRSTMNYTKVRALQTFDRAHGEPPPSVPEGRRPLLERYFVRPATPSDSKSAGAKPAGPAR